MMDKLIAFITFGLSEAELKVVRDFSWRVIVTGHMMFACGFLAFIGPAWAGFAFRQDVADINMQFSRLEESWKLQARLGVVREIRLQSEALCSLDQSSEHARRAIRQTLDRLKDDYRMLTGQQYIETGCAL